MVVKAERPTRAGAPGALAKCLMREADTSGNGTGRRVGRPGRSVAVLGQVAVRVVARLALIREPTVGPDLRGAEDLAAGPQDDADRLGGRGGSRRAGPSP